MEGSCRDAGWHGLVQTIEILLRAGWCGLCPMCGAVIPASGGRPHCGLPNHPLLMEGTFPGRFPQP